MCVCVCWGEGVQTNKDMYCIVICTMKIEWEVDKQGVGELYKGILN